MAKQKEIDYAELVRAAANDDTEAFNEIFNSTISTIKGLCFNYMKNAEDAEDMAMQT